MELAYSLHIGSDRNKRINARKAAKSNSSGSTSLSNNAIQNARSLSRVDKHNYRKYDNDTNLIKVIRGTNSLYDDVKNLYKKEFEEARIKYNLKQTRDDRKIDDYFKKISDNSKNDLACEMIIELGDKEYWDDKDDEFKEKMTNVYDEQVQNLEQLVPNFKVASAVIHFDETSPHMHIVGVPIKEKNKNGMERQVGKSDVFTKEKLIALQDKMREYAIKSFNKEYGLNMSLKEKQKGRNKDYKVSEMTNYIEMKKEIEKNKTKLKELNDKSLKLDDSSLKVKETIDKLKKAPIIKNTYTISLEDKEKIINYIENVNETNNDYKKINKLSATLENAEEELNENKEIIEDLTLSNKKLSRDNDKLNEKVKKQEKQIDRLENENYRLRDLIDNLKMKFERLIKMIKDKFFTKHKEKYNEFTNDLFSKDIISLDTYSDLKTEYKNAKYYTKDKEKDDFDISL